MIDHRSGKDGEQPPRGRRDNVVPLRASAPACAEEMMSFRAMLEDAPDAVWVADAAWRLIFANNLAKEQLAGSLEVLGRSLWSAFPLLAQSSFAEPLQRVAVDARAITFEAQSEPAGIWHRVRAFPLNGGVAAYVTADLPEDVRAATSAGFEARLRLLAHATGQLIWQWDLQTDKVERSVGPAGAFGYSAADLAAEPGWWSSRIHDEDRDRVLGRMLDLLVGPRDDHQDEYRLRAADGRFVHVREQGRLQRDEAGKPVLMVGTMSEIGAGGARSPHWRLRPV